MAQLKSARLNDQDVISSVDDGLGLAEVATATIFGIPVNTEIGSAGESIFGSVNAEAEIGGLIRIRDTTGIEATAAGISFRDDAHDIEVRLVPLNATADDANDDYTGLEVWLHDPIDGGGVLIQDLAMKRYFKHLEDGFDYESITASHGKYLAIAADGSELTYGTPAGIATNVCDLSDTPAATAPQNYSGYENRILSVNPAGTATEWVVGGGSGTYVEFIDLDDTPAVYDDFGDSMVYVKDTEDGLSFVPEFVSVVTINIGNGQGFGPEISRVTYSSKIFDPWNLIARTTGKIRLPPLDDMRMNYIIIANLNWSSYGGKHAVFVDAESNSPNGVQACGYKETFVCPGADFTNGELLRTNSVMYVSVPPGDPLQSDEWAEIYIRARHFESTGNLILNSGIVHVKRI